MYKLLLLHTNTDGFGAELWTVNTNLRQLVYFYVSSLATMELPPQTTVRGCSWHPSPSCRRYALHEVPKLPKLPRAAALTHGSARRQGCRRGARLGTVDHWSFYESLQRSREGQQEIFGNLGNDETGKA